VQMFLGVIQSSLSISAFVAFGIVSKKSNAMKFLPGVFLPGGFHARILHLSLTRF
jgi:hypothetical protein